MINLELTSASHLTLTDTRFIIKQDVELSTDVTIGVGCILSFQGGSIFSANGSTLNGQMTAIEAVPIEIFGGSIKFSGSWKVPEGYPEWFPIDNEDDATRINKAAKMLKFSGGILKLTRSYNIKSTIEVPILVCLEGCNPYSSCIEVGPNFVGDEVVLTDTERLSTYSLYEESPITLGSATRFSHITTLRPAIHFISDQTNNRACGAKNFTLRCNNKQCDGIVVDNAYDQSTWENIQVEGIHLIRSGFVFRRSSGNVGQTVLIKNCVGHKYQYKSSDTYDDLIKTPEGDVQETVPAAYIGCCFHNGIPSAPVFKFYRMHETTLIGCKAFPYSPNALDETYQTQLNADLIALFRNANQIQTGITDDEILAMPAFKEYQKEATYRLLGGTSFEFMDCRGITIKGCSISDALTGILIKAKNRYVDGISISGLTSENLWSYDVFADGNYTVYDLSVMPIRKENSLSGIMLTRCELCFIVTTKEQDIALKAGTHNVIYSVRPVNTLLRVPTQEENPTPNPPSSVVEEVRSIPAGNTNILVPSYHTASRGGLNVLNKLIVRNVLDNAYAVPDDTGNLNPSPLRLNRSMSIGAIPAGGIIESNGKERMRFSNTTGNDSTAIKNNSGNELLKVATAGEGKTALRLQVNVGGTMMYLPVEIGPVENGYCTLRVKIN